MRFWSPKAAGEHSRRSLVGQALHFNDASEAFSYIVRWDGKTVVPLLAAIQCARATGGEVIQRYLRNALIDLSHRIPLPEDVPMHVSEPILAVDREGYVLVGAENNERITPLSELRKDLARIDAKVLEEIPQASSN